MGAADDDSWADFAARLVAVGAFGAVGAACRLEIASLQAGDDKIFALSGSEGCSDVSVSASGYFIQNMLGSFFIAMVAQRNRHMRDALSVGWSTGFCGSLTTFATWMQYTAVLFASGRPNLAWATLVGSHCTCLCSHKLGQLLSQPGYCMKVLRGEDEGGEDAAVASRQVDDDDEDGSSSEEDDDSDTDAADDAPGSAQEVGATPAPGSVAPAAGSAAPAAGAGAAPVAGDSARVDRRRDVACMLFWPALALVASLLTVTRWVTAIVNSKEEIWAALAMAPFGAMLRYVLSIGNKRCGGWLPWFTLAANMLGCLADALAVWQGALTDDPVTQNIWAAFSGGFGGSLSTVSTFIGELRGPKIPELRERVVYAMLSYTLAMAILVPINVAFTCD